jgi:DNA-binding MltR family transcriptional regulator
MSSGLTPDSAFANVDRFGAVLEEFASGDDRTAAILGASLIDDCLEQALRFVLRHNEEAVQRLFEEGEPALGTFSAKIDLSAALGIIGPVTYKDLGRVRKIRNLFAHKMLMKDKGPSLARVSFATQQIVDLCNALKFVSEHMDLTRFGTNPRSRYMQTCVTASFVLFGYVNASQGQEQLVGSLP